MLCEHVKRNCTIEPTPGFEGEWLILAVEASEKCGGVGYPKAGDGVTAAGVAQGPTNGPAVATPQACREFPFDAPVEIRACGFMGMSGEGVSAWRRSP